MGVRPDGSMEMKSASEIYKIDQMMLLLEHHMRTVSAHFFDRRFSDDQFAKTLEFMVKNLKSNHLEFQVPIDRFKP